MQENDRWERRHGPEHHHCHGEGRGNGGRRDQGPSPQNMTPLMLVNEVSKLFHDSTRIEMDRRGIPNGYRHLLFHLAREDGIIQSDLTYRTHLKASTVSVTLHKMEDEGLVSMKPDPDDQRQTRVYLTPKGRAADDSIREIIGAAERRVFQEFSQQEYDELKAFLLRIRENFLNEMKANT